MPSASRSSAALEDASHALVADLEALRPHLVSNCPQRSSLGTQGGNFSDGLLLRSNRNERAVNAHLETKGDISAEKAPPGFLVGFGLSNSLPDAVALSLGKSRGDGQEQLADPVARDVAAEVEQVQLDALPLRLSTTLSASGAERNRRSSLAAMTMRLAAAWRIAGRRSDVPRREPNQRRPPRSAHRPG
jgi:hypothetical protein